jgi:Na+/H+ antiporter NhaD/arsenite permease-like protein
MGKYCKIKEKKKFIILTIVFIVQEISFGFKKIREVFQKKQKKNKKKKIFFQKILRNTTLLVILIRGCLFKKKKK